MSYRPVEMIEKRVDEVVEERGRVRDIWGFTEAVAIEVEENEVCVRARAA